MAIPGGTSITVSDLVPDVIEALQGRTDVSSIAPKYLKKAIQEVTQSYQFCELEQEGPIVPLIIGQSAYPVSYFLQPGDDYTMPNSFFVYIDFPTNTVKGPIDYRTPKVMEMMTSVVTQGIPSRYTRYGRNFILGPVPDQTYYVGLKYQQKHPFPQDNAAIGGTPVLLPESWHEIVVYSAAERIAVVKRWNDQRKELHDLLYGDPEYVASEGKRGRPGVISARLFQQERDEKFNNRSITPHVPRYNAR